MGKSQARRIHNDIERKEAYQSTQPAEPKHPSNSVLSQIRMVVHGIAVNLRVDRSKDCTSDKSHLIIMSPAPAQFRLSTGCGRRIYTKNTHDELWENDGKVMDAEDSPTSDWFSRLSGGLVGDSLAAKQWLTLCRGRAA